MSAFADILSALNTQLATLSLPTASEGKDYKPTNSTLYVRPTILPADTTQAELGSSGQDENLGIYQVDVFAPIDTGHGVAVTQADAIADAFARGTTLTYNSVNVRIRGVSRGAGRRDGAWYIVPVFINYFSFTQPR